MQKLEVLVECDAHAARHEANETVSFAVDGRHYEIDLCEVASKRMRSQLAKFTDAARVVRSRRARRNPRRTHADRERSQNVRATLQAAGIPVNGRGRLPKDAMEKYDEIVNGH